MEKLKNYKTLILVLLVIILFLFIWYRILPHFTNKSENFTDEDSVNMMNALIGKNVYIACDVAGEKKYLTVLPEKCLAINCQNVAVLQKDKSEFSLFEMGKHPELNKYTIRSQNKDINNPTFNHLNNNLCFSDILENIYFETELTDNGILFKANDLFVGLCSNDSACGNNVRLCLLEKHLAVPFRFEMTTPKKLENFENFLVGCSSTPKKLENFDNASIFLPSMYSESFYSNDTLMSSIPGAGYIDNNYQNL